MFKSYLKTALRNLAKNQSHATINIAGLAVGMAVAMLIGLWIWDNLSFEKYNSHYHRIARVLQNMSSNGEVFTYDGNPFPLADALRNKYGSDFKQVVMGYGPRNRVLSHGDKILSQTGGYFEPMAPELMDLKMIHGSRAALNDPAAIILSASVAKAYFGNTNPVNQLMKIGKDNTVRVAGVYEDLPGNSVFAELGFIAAWQQLYNAWNLKDRPNPWRMNAFQVYVQLADNADLQTVSAKIKDVKLQNVQGADAISKPQLFLQPMSEWHLHSEFKNGVSVGGKIKSVWLCGIIGAFVLLLACINFMNLSTARSEKRAREVGIRKAVGSLRRQLVVQFFSESLLVAFFAFVVALLLTALLLPFFNELTDKKMEILWSNPPFWLLCIGFTLLTGLIAGSYPALYLSSFRPIKVLKGTFRAGRLAAMPRRVLIVLQFSVSVILIIGTIVVFRQIRFAQNRPIGYDRDGLVMVRSSDGIHDHLDAVKQELLKTGAIKEMSETESFATEYGAGSSNFEWRGKDPALATDFPTTAVSYDYGKTVGWQMKEGRDFSRAYGTDSAAFIVNEAAVQFMGLKNPVGETVKWFGRSYTIIGVVKDIIVESPYAPVRPFFFYISDYSRNTVIMRINPERSAADALAKIAAVFKKYDPSQPFDYHFADEEYARKFADEQRTGKLAGFFAILAIFISCLGLFGMASFVAEQRTREIGVRKVLGASVLNLWGLLSKEFVVLVAFSLLIAIPASWYFMHNWLQNYAYRTAIAWWIFAAAGAGAMLITLLTVSYQSIRAALANPVKSLRTE